MLDTKKSVIRFADVEVREREFSLVKAGKVVAVEPKAFRVLLFLLHNPQKLITKEELLDAVWGETAVSENSLTRSIALLRHLLGDDPHQPRFIETVATVGYRFVCPVEVIEDEHGGLAPAGPAHVSDGDAQAPNNEEGAREVIPAKGHGRMDWIVKRKWLAAGVVVGVGLLSSAVWYVRRPLPVPRVTAYTQIIHNTHQKTPVGTDGARLYFNDYYGPNPLGQSSTSGGEISHIPVSVPGPTMSDVSPDGSNLLVISDKLGLWSARILDGSLRRLADDRVRSAAWSPDGQSVVYWAVDGSIKVVRSDGTDVHKLIATQDRTGRFTAYDLKWSPDGSKIRFSMNYKIWEVSSDGSNLHPLFPAWQPSWGQCCGDWTLDGRFFIFLSQDSLLGAGPALPGSQMWVLDERRGSFRKPHAEPVQLTSGPIRWGTPIPSKDGKQIFARGAVLHGQLVRYDPRSHQFQPYLGGISAEFVTFSPDGKYVAYASFPEGILWRANRDGSNALQLTDRPWYPRLPRWSPDSSQILFFDRYAEARMQAFVVLSQGGTPRPLLAETKEPQVDPYWSPDGRKVIYGTGTYNTAIRVLDLATHQAVTLPGSEGLTSPRWSPDGRFVAAQFKQPRADELRIFDFETQKWSVLDKNWTGFPSWSRDGKFIYFLRPDADRGIYRIRPSGGPAELVLDLKGIRQTGLYEFWIGLDPEDTPMLLRDIGSDDIYALTLVEK